MENVLDSSPEKDRVILYNYFQSSASWRIRILLNLKKIEYEYKAVNMLADEHLTKEYHAINPYTHVPALWIDGHYFTESVAIAEYIEESRPTLPKLMPTDPYKRSLVRKIVEHINSGIQPLQNLKVIRKVQADYGGDPKEWSTHWNQKGHIALEDILKQTAGKYCVGDSLSLADVFLYPQTKEAIASFGVKIEDHPTISRVLTNLLELPDFLRADPENQPDAKTSVPK